MSRPTPDSDSPNLSAQPIRRRPTQLELFHTDERDIHLPSPPYEPVASSSQLLLGPQPWHVHDHSDREDSPAYRSHSSLHLPDMATSPERRNQEKRQATEQLPFAKPSVHYPDDVRSVPDSTDHAAADAFLSRSNPEYIPSGSRTPSIAGTEDEYEEDEDYDWSNEEDLVDEEARFEEAMGKKKKTEGWTFRRVITFMFGSLIGSTITSGLIITPALLLHFYWYKPHQTDHRRYVTDNVEAWLFWIAANITISWGLALCLDIVPAVVRSVIALSWGHVSESVKTKLELYNSVKDNIKPVFYAASGWLSWVILFANIYDLYDSGTPSNSRASYTHRLYQTVEFLFFFALLYCIQRILVHAIAFSFHRTAYKERLDDVQEALRAIEQLRTCRPKNRHASKYSGGFTTPVLAALGFASHGASAPRPGSRPNSRPGSRNASPMGSRPGTPTPNSAHALMSGSEPDMSDRETFMKRLRKKRAKQQPATATATGTDVSESEPAPRPRRHRYPPTPANSPQMRSPGGATPRRRDGADGEEATVTMVSEAATQAARALKTAVLHDARNISGKHADEEATGLVWGVTSSHEAKRLARSIYTAFKARGRRELVPGDFYPAFPTQAAAQAAFRVFDKDNNGNITRAEVKATLLEVYKERRFLSRSMRDASQALETLDQILLFFGFVILFFISLSIFGVNITKSLTSLYTLGIGASFIFKNAAGNAFDAIMFLFVTHPFDTGDRCFIDDENFVVKKMGLFATIFARNDGTETYYFNSQLFNKFIINVRRSGNMAEAVTLQVAWKTPLEKLDELEKCLNDWLSREENRWYEPSTGVTLQNVNYQRYMEVTVGIPHNSNWQDWGLRLQRKTAFHAACQFFCRQLSIVFYESAMPVVWADDDTLEPISSSPMPPSPLAGEDEVSDMPDMSEAEPAHKSESVSWLGFQPPAYLPTNIRARKSRSKKAMLRRMGGDGGGGDG